MSYYKGGKHKDVVLPLDELIGWRNAGAPKNNDGNPLWHADTSELQHDKMKVHLLLEGVSLYHKVDISFRPYTQEEKRSL